MAKKKAKKSARKKLKLRKKPLADLPAKKKRAATVKGGATLTTATGTSLTTSALTPSPTQTAAFAPPYVPVGPVLPRQ